MATKYIVDNLSGQTINGDLTINGNLTTTNLNNSGTYRALLTQTGSISGNSSDFNNRLIIGETYQITDYATYDDFSNVADVQSGGIFNFDYDWTTTLSGSFNGLTGTTSGLGSGASFNGYWCGTTTPIIINITTNTSGVDYAVGDTITILGTELSGSTPTNDLTITVTEVNNETGCVFIATGDTPIVWGNSVLTSVGDLIVDVLENTLGDELVWVYDPNEYQVGQYAALFSEYINNNNLCKKFISSKTQITTSSAIIPFNGDIYSNIPLIVLTGIGSLIDDGDEIILSVFDVNIGDFVGDSLYYTPIEIKLNSITTQEEEPLISINWGVEGGDDNFDTYDIELPPILNVSRLTTSCGYATAHVHNDFESSDLTIDLYDNSIEDWVTVWEYTLNNPNYDVDDSPDFNFPGNIDVTFTNITSVGGIRVTSDPEQEQTYHDFDTLRFNFFN
jgi:hypothetical protein